MKCPLLTAGFLSKDKWKEAVRVDCMEQTCAMYDTPNVRCSIYGINVELVGLNHTMEEIQNTMYRGGTR